MIDLPQKQILAILFAGGEAVEIERIAQAIGADEDTVLKYIPHIRSALETAGLPFELLRLGDKLQLCTAAAYAQVIREALELRRNIPLSQAALEVLAVIAYNQPVTRAFIEQVRGVDSSGVVNSLLEKVLIEEAGRLELPGRPISYKTTENFLRCFGIESLAELPTLPEADEQEELPDDVLEGQVGFEQDRDKITTD
ncbi:SMC-Scp complex subunit ScpB [Oscillospiraceae bacterium PP1C4]